MKGHYLMAYGYNNRDFKNINWDFGIANLVIVAFCMAVPGLIFVYIIGLMIFCSVHKRFEKQANI
jgi:hypothetical protein